MTIIRPMTEDDVRAVLEVHREAVQRLAGADYSQEVLERWSPPVDDRRIRHFPDETDDEIRLVAEKSGGIVGFGVVAPPEREIRACYVAPAVVRQGVGTRLLEALERRAKQQGVETLKLESSLTARGFYLANGYEIVESGQFRLDEDVAMESVAMRKHLGG